MLTTKVQISLRIRAVDEQSDQRLCCSLLRYYNTYTWSIQNLKNLASLCSWAGQFESYLVENPEDRFSRDEAQT